MTLRPITIAYHWRYLDWKLGAGHPTNPERARLAVRLIRNIDPTSEMRVPQRDLELVRRDLQRVHETAYIERALAGDLGGEAEGVSTRRGLAAAYMFDGTAVLVRDMLRNDMPPGVWFNPQGAKHHAMYDRAAGFCAFNDMAWAAKAFAGEGQRVGYLDWDAHAGDGVQTLTWNESAVTTFSIHQQGIFPGTANTMRDYPVSRAYNRLLEAGDGDEDLHEYVREALTLFERQGVTVLLLAAGADGLAEDPLSSLKYTQVGLCQAAQLVGEWAARLRVPILVGGAGGYKPLDETPMAWAGVVLTLQRELYKVHGDG